MVGTCRVGPEWAFSLLVTEGQSQASHSEARRPGPGQVPGCLGGGRRLGESHVLCPCSTCLPRTRRRPSAGRWWTSASRCMPATRPFSRRWPLCSELTTDPRAQAGPSTRTGAASLPLVPGRRGPHGRSHRLQAGQGRGIVCLGMCPPTRPAGRACQPSARPRRQQGAVGGEPGQRTGWIQSHGLSVGGGGLWGPPAVAALLNWLAASACGRSWPPPGHTVVSSTPPTGDASVQGLLLPGIPGSPVASSFGLCPRDGLRLGRAPWDPQPGSPSG